MSKSQFNKFKELNNNYNKGNNIKNFLWIKEKYINLNQMKMNIKNYR